MSDDRKQRDQSREADIELPVDDLSPKATTAEEAETVKGGLRLPPASPPANPSAPPGVPIPYPNITSSRPTG